MSYDINLDDLPNDVDDDASEEDVNTTVPDNPSVPEVTEAPEDWVQLPLF